MDHALICSHGCEPDQLHVCFLCVLPAQVRQVIHTSCPTVSLEQDTLCLMELSTTTGPSAGTSSDMT